MVTAVFVDNLEKKHGVPDGVDSHLLELQRQRPVVQRIQTHGMFMYFLEHCDLLSHSNLSANSRGNRSSNQIEAFYSLFRPVVKTAAIPGVNVPLT
jgi:hypothetical protein